MQIEEGNFLPLLAPDTDNCLFCVRVQKKRPKPAGYSQFRANILSVLPPKFRKISALCSTGVMRRNFLAPAISPIPRPF